MRGRPRRFNIGRYLYGYGQVPESYTILDRKRLKLKAIEYLGGVCVDCNTMPHHAAMEFHHNDPTEKKFNVSSRLLGVNWNRIASELDKCILLCSNCHQIRHWNKQNALSYLHTGARQYKVGVSTLLFS